MNIKAAYEAALLFVSVEEGLSDLVSLVVALSEDGSAFLVSGFFSPVDSFFVEFPPL